MNWMIILNRCPSLYMFFEPAITLIPLHHALPPLSLIVCFKTLFSLSRSLSWMFHLVLPKRRKRKKNHKCERKAFVIFYESKSECVKKIFKYTSSITNSNNPFNTHIELFFSFNCRRLLSDQCNHTTLLKPWVISYIAVYNIACIFVKVFQGSISLTHVLGIFVLFTYY